jgi:hypothetical protein
MNKTLAIILSLMALPGAAFAQQGSGTDLYRVQREWDQIMRDGRYERLLREGQANKEAFDRLKQLDSDPTATASTPRQRR